jgi:hypothetical protein
MVEPISVLTNTSPDLLNTAACPDASTEGGGRWHGTVPDAAQPISRVSSAIAAEAEVLGLRERDEQVLDP